MIEVDVMQYQIPFSPSSVINHFRDKFSSAKAVSVKIKDSMLYIKYKPPSDSDLVFRAANCKCSAIFLMALKRNQTFDGMYWVVMHEIGCLEHPSQIPCFGDLS